jgi:hypothetical protein
MSLLERWDRRNQRTAEWQRHVANEEAHKRRSPSWIVLGGFILLVTLLRRVVSRYIGFGWTMTILAALTVACFAMVIVDARRKRRAWEASQDEPG